MAARRTLIFIGIIHLLLLVGGCTQPPEPVDSQPNTNAVDPKEEIDKALSSNKDITKVTWSPDETIVLYILKRKTNQEDISTACARRVEEDQEQIVLDVSPGFQSFTWSPDSQHFIISETSGEGVINRIYQSISFEKELEILSVDIPVWSPDSSMLAYGFVRHSNEDIWGSLKVQRLGQAEGEFIWNTKNYRYEVEYWDTVGTIGYLEINDKQEQRHKTTQNIRPSISGVHLGDTGEQVKAALGGAYSETPPGEETMNFPEPVYRWSYAEGYEVFIGKDTDKVWEIMATAPGAETNLGVKIGDQAEKVWEIYRNQYIEPESIHGGRLYGIFKVEGAAALAFRFDIEEGTMRPEIKPENRVVSMDLTYPNIMDDDF